MYRILRNNKEQGPLGLDELLQLKLRPYDLIWVEGKSACWRYPTEIDTLKSYVNGSTPSNAPTPEVAQVPVVKPAEAPPVPEVISMEVEEEALTATILEQKANAIYQRVQAYNQQREEQEKDVHTKYVRSLDDLRQDYADWLHGKRRKKETQAMNYKGWMACGAVSAAFVIFLLAGRDKDNMWPGVAQKGTSAKTIKAASDNHEALSPIRKQPIPTQSVSIEQQAALLSFMDSMRAVLRKKEMEEKAASDKTTSPKRRAPVIQLNTNPIDEGLPPLVETAKKPSIKAADLDAQYVAGENNSKIKELNVTVHNTGTVMLKQVTVDVFYYKKGDRLLEQETLYFTDIGPGNSFTINKPGNKKATTARFELGQLVAE